MKAELDLHEQASHDGIDTRANIIAGLDEFRNVLLANDHGAVAAATVANVIDCLAAPDKVNKDRLQYRNELIDIRSGLLKAARFQWVVLCSHAIWWLAVDEEGMQ